MQNGGEEAVMIFIVVKFETKPEWTERWPELVEPFTAGTRAEEGNLGFEWSRSLDNLGGVRRWSRRSATATPAARTSTASTSRPRSVTSRRLQRLPRSSVKRSTPPTGRSWPRSKSISRPALSFSAFAFDRVDRQPILGTDSSRRGRSAVVNLI